MNRKITFIFSKSESLTYLIHLVQLSDEVVKSILSECREALSDCQKDVDMLIQALFNSENDSTEEEIRRVNLLTPNFDGSHD